MMFDDVLDRKVRFLEYKKVTLPKWKNYHFFKGANPGF